MLEPWNPATLNLGTLTLFLGTLKLLDFGNFWNPGPLEPWNFWNLGTLGTLKATWTFGHCFDKALKRSYFQTTLARLV